MNDISNTEERKMNDFDELLKVMKIVDGELPTSNVSPIPLFSFEGLPGVGKTTQIKLVSENLYEKYGKSCYIDLPTKSPIGKVLKALYADEEKWNTIRTAMPWLNPIAISTDLRLTIDNAIESGAKYAIMSRGILSTYYYNLDAYGEKDINMSWGKMEKDMKGFYYPTAIIFMDLPEEEAHKRVVSRNRGPLRAMDQVEQMKKDKIVFEDYLKRIGDIPIHYIDASGTREEVTDSIMVCLEEYLEKI